MADKSMAEVADKAVDKIAGGQVSDEEAKKAFEALLRPGLEALAEAAVQERAVTAEDLPREVNRAGWPPGPWDDELDKYEWRSNGYPCLVVRAPVTGALCGYVGLRPGHPWYGKGYDDIEIEVHGGLTYSNTGCRGHICHVPGDGEDDLVHWIGFDCSHFRDVMPQLEATRIRAGLPERPGGIFGFGTYKDVAYVRAEVERLRGQAEAAARAANAHEFPRWPEE